MQPEPTVFVIDDEQAVREQIRWLLQSVGLSVATYRSGEDFLAAYDPARPGCVLLDVRMPGLSGPEVQAQLALLPHSPPVILLTAHADVPLAVGAMKAGALHVLQKPYRAEELLDTVRQALRWEEQMRQDRATRQEVQGRLASLTPREREVLDLVVAGKPNKVIAQWMKRSEKMVEVYRARVMEKMRAGSLAELVRLVLQAQA